MERPLDLPPCPQGCLCVQGPVRRPVALRISLDLDRLALGGVPSRTRHPAVLVIQLAHSREITLGDNTLVVASSRSLPRQSLRRPAIPPVSHGVVPPAHLSSLSPLPHVLASTLSPPRGRSHNTARTETHARAHPSVAHGTHPVSPWGERWSGLVTYY